jgi:hypothetical protein
MVCPASVIFCGFGDEFEVEVVEEGGTFAGGMDA